MKYSDLKEYSNAVADMFDWNYTTFIRTYRYITPSVAARWGQKIANRRNVKAVYVSVERVEKNMEEKQLTQSEKVTGNCFKIIPKKNMSYTI